MADEEKKAPEAQEQAPQQDTFDFLKGKVTSFLSNASEVVSGVASNVADKVMDAKEQVTDVVNEKIRETEADKVFTKLGRNVYKLVKHNELQLPESCEKYIEALNDIYEDVDADDSKDAKACDDKCEEGKCCCEDKKEDEDKA